MKFNESKKEWGKGLAIVAALVLNSLYVILGSLKADEIVNSELSGVEMSSFGGDSEGRGHTQLRLSKAENKICYNVSVSGIDLPATETYIRNGLSEEEG